MRRMPRSRTAWLSPEYTQQKKTNPIQVQKTSNGFADQWDRIGLQTILKEKHRKLLKVKSDFQDIHIVETKDVRMYLNEQLQFSSVDERIYHEALIHPVFTLSRKRKRVLIVGGGDGLALREVLKYKDVKHVDLVDLDPEVLNAARNNTALASLNEYSLHDPRVRLHPVDAVKYLASNETTYHVIIVDFPDPTEKILSDLYTTEFFTLLKRSLSEKGLFVCQSNSPEDTPIVYWSIGKTMGSAGFQLLSYHTIVPSFGDWGFHIGSLNPISWSNEHVEVQHKTLPSRLSDMSYFPNLMLIGKNNAVVNTKKNSVLHKIFKKEVLHTGEE